MLRVCRKHQDGAVSERGACGVYQRDGIWEGVPGPESRLCQYSGNPYTCVLMTVECQMCAFASDLLSLPARDKAPGWLLAARQNCIALNYSSTAGEVLGWSGWKLWLVLTSLNTVGLWVAWGKRNPASSPGLPVGGEMPALLQLSPCPAQDSTNTSLSLPVCPCFVMGQEYQRPGRNIYTFCRHISGRTNLLLESVSLLSLERDDG